MTTTLTDTPKIYVACLASYNNGKLYGKWIDANQSADEIQEEIKEMLLNSPEPNIDALCCDECLAITHYPKDNICPECGSDKTKIHPTSEEWAIHDYEGFGDLKIDEYESIEEVARLAELIEEHGEAFAAYASYIGQDYADADNFEEAYCGEWDSEEEYAEDLMQQCYEIPEYLQFYIDYEKWARDLFINDYFSAESSNGKVYVFRHV